MQKRDLKKYSLPDAPGVYIFRGKRREVLYVGKATSLKQRVRSYFSPDLIEGRGERIVLMVQEAKSLTWEETDSVLEALILEAHLIKKHQPPFNAREKDNKSFNYLVITDEDFPRVLVMRGRELAKLSANSYKLKATFGPFPQGGSLKTALKIVRKIFPFRDKCTPCVKGAFTHFTQRGHEKNGVCKPCFNRQIGLCPGVCSGEVSKRAYAQTVRHIALLFSGKKQQLVEKLEREMAQHAKREEYEEADEKRRQIHALTHIRDVALIDDSFRDPSGASFEKTLRIEGYDIAHTSGSETVGVMTVVENGEAKKSDYRKFTIRTAKNDDTGALAEVLSRRLAHPEWPLPRLIVVDGGKGQVNAAEAILKQSGVSVPIVGVTKDERHRPKGFTGALPQKLIDARGGRELERDALLVNSEAHRFALTWHRKRRGKVR